MRDLRDLPASVSRFSQGCFGFSRRDFRATLTAVIKLLTFFAGLILPLAGCLADGGVILARQTINGLDLTVFASPVPLRAGPADISVLIQDTATGMAVLDGAVEVAWSSVSPSAPEWLPPCCSMNTATDKIAATLAHSQNKLLYSAIVPIRSSGASELVIRATAGSREALLSCPVEAGPPSPPAAAYWPWLALPPFCIVGFCLHQRISRAGGRGHPPSR